MRFAWLAAVAALALPASAAPPMRPVVVELFTSEGCASCPPADALLTDLVRHRADLLPLAFHVTYWNKLGWEDPYSLPAATERQRDYARRRGSGDVFTPELVVDGGESVIGSDRDAAEAAIRSAAARQPAAPAIRVVRDGENVRIEVGAGSGSASVLLIGFDPQHRTQVGRGENRGRTLLESNIVRSLTPLGRWSGAARALAAPAPAGEQVAVILQAADGRILGAARGG
jgi:hypothetical protein